MTSDRDPGDEADDGQHRRRPAAHVKPAKTGRDPAGAWHHSLGGRCPVAVVARPLDSHAYLGRHLGGLRQRLGRCRGQIGTTAWGDPMAAHGEIWWPSPGTSDGQRGESHGHRHRALKPRLRHADRVPRASGTSLDHVRAHRAPKHSLHQPLSMVPVPRAASVGSTCGFR